MSRLVALVIRYGVPLVALNVFLEQIGAPIPAVPTLVVAGALTRNGRMSSTMLMASSVAASLVADYAWFLLGRRYGFRVLRLLCRLSLSPDSCVRDTETRFERWGMKSLLIAKFVPGFSTVAPPLAGMTSHGTAAFLAYDAAGAFLWAGAAVAGGRLFHHAIARLLAALENLGWWAIVILGLGLAVVILFKYWQRVSFLRRLRVARVAPAELHDRIEAGHAPIVLDVRTRAARRSDPRKIPTAIVATAEEIDRGLDEIQRGSDIVLYCT